MPNAKNFQADKNAFLLIGPSNSGKTTTLRTLPGKGFTLFTDPNGPVSVGPLREANGKIIPGSDIDYELFIRDANVDEKGNPDKPQALRKLRAWLSEKRKANFFEPYDWIALDNISFLFDIVMDDFLAYRVEKPKDPDQPKQIEALRHAMPLQGQLKGVLADLRHAAFDDGKGRALIFIGHEVREEDFVSGAVTYRGLNAWGKLAGDIPSYVSHVFYCDRRVVGQQQFYKLIVNDAAYGTRSAWQGLPRDLDASIKDWTKPSAYGLGKLLTDYGALKNA